MISDLGFQMIMISKDHIERLVIFWSVFKDQLIRAKPRHADSDQKLLLCQTDSFHSLFSRYDISPSLLRVITRAFRKDLILLVHL